MIPHHIYYPLVVVGLLCWCVMLHYIWASRGAVSLQPLAEPVLPQCQMSHGVYDKQHLANLRRKDLLPQFRNDFSIC